MTIFVFLFYFNKKRCICGDIPYACVYFKSDGAQQRYLYSRHNANRTYFAGDGTPSVLHATVMPRFNIITRQGK